MVWYGHYKEEVKRGCALQRKKNITRSNIVGIVVQKYRLLFLVKVSNI